MYDKNKEMFRKYEECDKKSTEMGKDLDEVITGLRKELKFWKEQNEILNARNRDLTRQITELETKLKMKVVDYSARDDVEVLKEVIKRLLENKPEEAIKIVMEII